MITEVLSPDVQQFIRDHENDDERKIVLQQKSIHGVPANIIAAQIIGRRKAKEKLPLYYQANNIIYPPTLNLEQSSSEQTAKYKVFLLQTERPNQKFGQGVDLSGGFGIDTFFLSQLFRQFHYVESNQDLLEIARHNHHQLGATNIIYHNTTADQFLDAHDHPLDLIFIDPSRRTRDKKVFTLNDSQPNIVALQKNLFTRAARLLVKASPILDIKLAIKELNSVKKVFTLAVENEVKELLIYCEQGSNNEPEICAVNLEHVIENFNFFFSEEQQTKIDFSDPLSYLYEPNASILKSGAFKTVAKKFNLKKIHINTHLYTADALISSFPGRIFKIEDMVKPEWKELTQLLPEGKANIITRNYPLSVNELKKKTKLKDGGEKYIIGFAGDRQKFLVVATRIK